MTLELKKFDMKNISFKPTENAGPVIVLIGRRDTGKSFLVRDLKVVPNNFVFEVTNFFTALSSFRASIFVMIRV